jgi:hypothetical protein
MSQSHFAQVTFIWDLHTRTRYQKRLIATERFTSRERLPFASLLDKKGYLKKHFVIQPTDPKAGMKRPPLVGLGF